MRENKKKPEKVIDASCCYQRGYDTGGSPAAGFVKPKSEIILSAR
tara:strand:+ start:50 stop:184 length:135 start_codon:yes stop_codon:yes gene_type:complete